MSNANRAKNQNTSGCCCCGTRSKKNPKDDVSNNWDDKGEDNFDDASHITSIKNRNQSTLLEVESSNPKSKKKSKGNKRNKLSKGATDQENSTLMVNKTEKNRGSCKKCCLKFTAFLFSHIGLSSLVVGYSIMGGFLFQWLESDSEKQVRSDISKVRDDYVKRLWDMTEYFNVLHEGNWSIGAQIIMKEFQDEVYLAVKEKGWDGRDEHAPEKQWSFPGSLLFSVTVITTIGYGHIAPKTDMGRLATIFYALVGIPLTLLFLANIGGFFGNCFRFLYKHFCNAIVWLCCPNHFRQNKSSSSPNSKRKKDGKAKDKSQASVPEINVEDAQKQQTIFNEKDTLETLQWKTSSPSALDNERGYGTASDCPDVFSRDNDSQNNRQETGVHEDIEKAVVVRRSKKKLKDEVRVPIIVSLLIIALYIFGGACLFSVWEKDWNYLIGSYFCFITLSTVGFGDYVFGTGSDWNDNGKLIICALYLVFGLSILAMTFDLMQEEVRAKFRWLGTKFGIINEENEAI